MTAGRLRTALSVLDEATEWLNSPPLTASHLHGNVVAVQFCTYSCVNWIRTLPYVRAWAGDYRDDGLVVVGAHAPEFRFERDLEGVRRALAELRVVHPVVLDNDYAIWRSFGNRYWPALYLLDGEGRVRYRHFGEGAYAETEAAIRQLSGSGRQPVNVEAGGIEAPAAWETLESPETYVGTLRGERRVDDDAERLEVNQWALAGGWVVEDEAAVLDTAPGSIAYRFHARDVNLVLTPPIGASAVPFTVRLDGRPPGPAHGMDVDELGRGAVSEPRLYQLVREPGPVRERTFDVTFAAPGVRAYVFTFG